MEREKNNNQGTHSDERTLMQRAWEYVLLLFNVIASTDNLF